MDKDGQPPKLADGRDLPAGPSEPGGQPSQRQQVGHLQLLNGARPRQLLPGRAQLVTRRSATLLQIGWSAPDAAEGAA